MWNTPEGDRVLTGAEARLFLESVISLSDSIFSMPDYFVDVPLFDRLSALQRIILLRDVSEGLLLPCKSVVPLTALNAATIAAVYAEATASVQCEIDLGGTGCRRDVLAAVREHDDTDLPDARSSDMTRWSNEIEWCCLDRILWDRDFEMIEDALDQSPDVRKMVNAQMGIDDDYFIAIPPDPRGVSLESCYKELVTFLRAQVKVHAKKRSKAKGTLNEKAG